MQLIPTNRIRLATPALLVGVFLIGACHKTVKTPVATRVSLCQLYANPTAYDGKPIRVDATLTALPDGNYIYPGPTANPCAESLAGGSYSFIKLDASHVENAALVELKTQTGSPPERKEFDVELTGTFDSNYSEPWDHFRYRIVALEIKPVSSVRIGKRLGAA